MGESIPARRISVHQALGGGAGEPLLSNSLIITRYERDPFIYNHNCLWFWLQMDLIFQMIIFFLLILGILFIGIVADLLLWKIWSGNVTILGMATTMWMLFELAGYNLLSFVANVLLLLVVILFFWAKSASLLNRFFFTALLHLSTFSNLNCIFAFHQFYLNNEAKHGLSFMEKGYISFSKMEKWLFLFFRPLPPLPDLEISEETIVKAAGVLQVYANHALSIAREITMGRNLKLFLQVIR